MINQNMKEKLTRNQGKFDEFKEGLAQNINKSLNMISQSRFSQDRPISSFGQKNNRNYLDEFNNIINKKKLNLNNPNHNKLPARVLANKAAKSVNPNLYHEDMTSSYSRNRLNMNPSPKNHSRYNSKVFNDKNDYDSMGFSQYIKTTFNKPSKYDNSLNYRDVPKYNNDYLNNNIRVTKTSQMLADYKDQASYIPSSSNVNYGNGMSSHKNQQYSNYMKVSEYLPSPNDHQNNYNNAQPEYSNKSSRYHLEINGNRKTNLDHKMIAKSASKNKFDNLNNYNVGYDMNYNNRNRNNFPSKNSKMVNSIYNDKPRTLLQAKYDDWNSKY